MAVHVGTDPAAVYIGDQAATVYVGDQQVWPPDDPPTARTLWGQINLGMGGANGAFETSTGILSDCIRIYTGGANSTTNILRSPNPRSNPSGTRGMGPACTIVSSCRFAEDDDTPDSDIIDFLEDCETAAQALTPGVEHIVTMNPEPDRNDRSYSAAQFRTMHARFYDLKLTYAPSVKVALNLTGYQFDSRIGNFTSGSMMDQFEMLMVDPYWLQGDTHQATTGDVTDAHDWCQANGKRYGLGEWGVEKHDSDTSWQAEQVVDAIEFLAAFTDPIVEIAPYFEDDTSGPWQTKLDHPGSYAAYGTAVTAARAGA